MSAPEASEPDVSEAEVVQEPLAIVAAAAPEVRGIPADVVEIPQASGLEHYFKTLVEQVHCCSCCVSVLVVLLMFVLFAPCRVLL